MEAAMVGLIIFALLVAWWGRIPEEPEVPDPLEDANDWVWPRKRVGL